MTLHRWSGNFVVAIPADSGLYLVLALPELSELPRFRRSLEESYVEYVCRCDPVVHALSRARRVGKIFGMLRGGFLPRGDGAGLGPGRRRRPFQGPLARPGHPRRVPAGQVPGEPLPYQVPDKGMPGVREFCSCSLAVRG